MKTNNTKLITREYLESMICNYDLEFKISLNSVDKIEELAEYLRKTMSQSYLNENVCDIYAKQSHYKFCDISREYKYLDFYLDWVFAHEKTNEILRYDDLKLQLMSYKCEIEYNDLSTILQIEKFCDDFIVTTGEYMRLHNDDYLDIKYAEYTQWVHEVIAQVGYRTCYLNGEISLIKT